MHVRYSLSTGLGKYAHTLETDFNVLAKSYPHAMDEDPIPRGWRIGGYARAGPLADTRLKKILHADSEEESELMQLAVYGNNDPELRQELDEGLLQLEAMKRIGGQIARIDKITKCARRARSLG